MDRKKVMIGDLAAKKRDGNKITMLTAYDYPMARIADDAGVDIILVGDSVGMVVLGYDSTVPVTMDEMIHHSKAVRRGTKYAFLIGDMPFMSYQVSDEEAVRNAGRFMKEAGCDAVKLEGGDESISAAKAIIKSGIPVLGHLGLTPQTVSKLGGYRVQGKDHQAAERLIEQSVSLEKAGCFGIVLECVPGEVSKMISQRLKIPIISCGSGAGCDGQVMVTYDMIGIFDRFVPKFVKKYADLRPIILKAFKSYIEEVGSGIFPGAEHTFTIKDDELKKLKRGKK